MVDVVRHRALGGGLARGGLRQKGARREEEERENVRVRVQEEDAEALLGEVFLEDGEEVLAGSEPADQEVGLRCADVSTAQHERRQRDDVPKWPTSPRPHAGLRSRG